ncbi:hypothetical protein TNCV_4331941 [Trichonephila clavipes]|nr:hypothetical protein TNCV_4331941 [Trichonephila clavipes]
MPQTLDHLEDNIRRVIADIRPEMLEKSSKIGRPDWTSSEPAVAVLCQKSYSNCDGNISRRYSTGCHRVTLPNKDWYSAVISKRSRSSDQSH